MTPGIVSAHLDSLAAQIVSGQLSARAALDAAYALGVEDERLDTMHRACEGYSRAREAREKAFRKPGSVPPVPR